MAPASAVFPERRPDPPRGDHPPADRAWVSGATPAPASCAVCERRGVGPGHNPCLRILAVDDEVPVLEEILYLLRADPRVASADGVSDVASALKYLHQAEDSGRAPAAVFMDVRMPGLTGLDLARLLSRFAEPPALVFVTAHEGSAVEAFELKAVDYVLKPVRQARLMEAVHRVLHAVLDRTPDQPTPPPPPPAPQPETPPEPAAEVEHDDRDEIIPVDLGGITRFVRLADVRRIEAQRDYARLHTGTDSFLLRAPMASLERRWCPNRFVRIHRSHLVALAYVEELRTQGTTLTVRVGGELLPVSRRYAAQVRDVLVRSMKVNAPR